MSKNLSKYLSFLFAAFSVISGFFTVFTIEEVWIRNSIFLVTIACAIIAIFFFIRFKKYSNGSDALHKALKREAEPDSGFTVSTVSSEAELREIWNISQSIYGDNNVSFDIVHSWWKYYKGGIYVLRKNKEVVGYLSMWPIKKQTMKDICNGARREKELRIQSIAGDSLTCARGYWYITNLVVIKKYRRDKAILILLREAISQWLNKSNLAEQIQICALAYSGSGEAVLKRFGFFKKRNAEETLEKQPVYFHHIGRSELSKIIERIQ